MTEKLYEELKNYARLKCLNSPWIDHEDVLNEVLIEFIQRNEYPKFEIEAKIKNTISGIYHNSNNSTPKGDKFGRVIDKFCRKCSEVKPVGCFRIMKDKKRDTQFISTWCHDCFNAYERNRKKAKYIPKPRIKKEKVKKKRGSMKLRLSEDAYKKWLERKRDKRRLSIANKSDSYINELERRRLRG